MITTLGKAHIADQLRETPTQGKMLYIAIGTGTPSSTALGTELSRRALRSVTSSSNTTTYVGEWNIDDGVSGTITEMGIFNSFSGGTMLLSHTLSRVKGINDTLTLTVNLTL